MPAKRTVGKARRVRITPEMVAAFKAGDEETLDHLLGLKPWEASPLIAVGPCPWPPGTGGATSWPQALHLRAELESA